MKEGLKPLVEFRWLDEGSRAAAAVAGLRTVVERNLDEARGPLKYADTRFWLACQAVLAAATSVIRARTARGCAASDSTNGRSQRCASSASPAFPTVRATTTTVGRKRNIVEYDAAGRVSG